MTKIALASPGTSTRSAWVINCVDQYLSIVLLPRSRGELHRISSVQLTTDVTSVARSDTGLRAIKAAVDAYVVKEIDLLTRQNEDNRAHLARYLAGVPNLVSQSHIDYVQREIDYRRDEIARLEIIGSTAVISRIDYVTTGTVHPL